MTGFRNLQFFPPQPDAMAGQWNLSKTIYFPIGLFSLCWLTIFTYHFAGDIKAQVELAVNSVEEVLRAAGPYWGPLVVFFLYFVSTVLFLPLWGFHVTCGYVYGTFYAAALIICSQTISAVAAFAIARYLFKFRIRQAFLRSSYAQIFQAIDQGVSKNGFKIVGLLRLSPVIPFGFNNYLCGCTDMNLWEFAAATFFCTLPGTTVYCWIGSEGKAASDSQSHNTAQTVLKVVAILSTLALLKILSNMASRKLEEEEGISANKAVTD